MSFEILEYPLKKWILDIIDDQKIGADMFDLLGEPDSYLKYPSLILQDVDKLNPDSEKFNLIVRMKVIDRNDTEYKFDLKQFAECRKVSSQLVGILHDSNAVLRMIVKTIDEKYVKMFELDKLYITLMNGLKLKLCYEGNDKKIIQRLSNLNMYGFVSEIEYINEDDDDNDDDDDDDDFEAVKKILADLASGN